MNKNLEELTMLRKSAFEIADFLYLYKFYFDNKFYRNNMY